MREQGQTRSFTGSLTAYVNIFTVSPPFPYHIFLYRFNDTDAGLSLIVHNNSINDGAGDRR